MSNKIKILCVPANEGGCSYHRIIAPMRKLEEVHGDKIELRWNKNPLGVDEETKKWKDDWDFEDMKWADIIFLQNLSNFGGPYSARVVGKAKEFGKLVHYDTDDLLTNIYEGHRLYHTYKKLKLEETAAWLYNNADLVTVTQPKFKSRIMPYVSGKAEVVRNAIDYNLPSWRMAKVSKPRKNFTRIGWVGGIHHTQDLKHFAGVPHFVNQRVGRQNVRWDFYGHPPKHVEDWQVDVWKEYKSMFTQGMRGYKNWDLHYAQPADRYGQFYSNMDISIAPLEWNNFNECKSEIKVAECGRYAIPLVATDCGAYQEWIENGKTGFLIDPEAPVSEWIRVMTKVCKNPNLVKDMGLALKEITDREFDLNKNVDQRLKLYEEMISGKC